MSCTSSILIRKEGHIFRAIVQTTDRGPISTVGHDGWEAVGKLLYYHGPTLGIAEVMWDTDDRRDGASELNWLSEALNSGDGTYKP
jgi:hypothetical protein